MNVTTEISTLILEKWPALYFRLAKIPGICTANRDTQFWKLHARLLRDRRGTQRLRERYNLWTLACQAQALSGAYAEAGVYDGGSARILCEAKGAEHLHLFDTFAGMPETDTTADPHFVAGQFADTNRQKVADYLAAFPNVHLHQGFFPASTADVPATGNSNSCIWIWISIAPPWMVCGISIPGWSAKASLLHTITET